MNFQKNGNKIKIQYVGVCQKDVSIKVYDANDTNPHYYLYELGDLSSLRIRIVDSAIEDVLKASESKIKNLTQVYSVDSVAMNVFRDGIIKFKFSENKYDTNYIVTSKENLKKLEDFYTEIEQILNKNKYNIKFEVGHYTTGFSCIAELV